MTARELKLSTRTSKCVDCTTPIIGERLRCPACHDEHAAGLLAGDEDVTLRRDRLRRQLSIWQGVVAWIGTVLIIAVAVILVLLAGRGCQ